MCIMIPGQAEVSAKNIWSFTTYVYYVGFNSKTEEIHFHWLIHIGKLPRLRALVYLMPQIC